MPATLPSGIHPPDWLAGARGRCRAPFPRTVRPNLTNPPVRRTSRGKGRTGPPSAARRPATFPAHGAPEPDKPPSTTHVSRERSHRPALSGSAPGHLSRARCARTGQNGLHHGRRAGSVGGRRQPGGVEEQLEGVRTTADLLAGGLTAGRIRRLVRDGALRSLRPGVYASAGTVTALVGDARDEKARQAGRELLRVAAALAVNSSRAAGSHRSAARLYGLGLIGPDLEPGAEITWAPGGRPPG